MKYDEFYSKGYQIFNSVLSDEETKSYKDSMLSIYQRQVEEFGEENIRKAKEENSVRSPFLYDTSFISLFYSDFTKTIVRDILGDYAILSLQNGVFIPPNKDHHQSFYHRDLIHQNFTSSKPLSLNIYYCLDDYNKQNGGTTFIPYSHKKEYIEKHYIEETPFVSKGSVILFDSMLYHKAGNNVSDFYRYGVNNMFTLPFIKQQINYPYFLKNKTNDIKLNRLLGFESREYLNVSDFRNYRIEKNAK